LLGPAAGSTGGKPKSPASLSQSAAERFGNGGLTVALLVATSLAEGGPASGGDVECVSSRCSISGDISAPSSRANSSHFDLSSCFSIFHNRNIDLPGDAHPLALPFC
jgi:hypothetical protein